MSKSWIYHIKKPAKVVDDCDMPSFLEEGWAESPAFLEGEKFDASIPLEAMTKPELQNFCKKHFEVKLPHRLSKGKMAEQIGELIKNGKDGDNENGS